MPAAGENMGYRFRKTIRIAPGVRLNLSKSGMSTSIGRPGATLNLGKRGPRGTVGVPGSGLSFSAPLSPSGGGAQQSSGSCGCLTLLGVIGFLALMATCSQNVSTPSDALITGAAATTTTRYVSAASLNCRVEPRQTGRKVEGLRRGDAVEVQSVADGWSKLLRSGENCWAASRYLSESPPSFQPQGLMSTGTAAGASYAGGRNSASRKSKAYKKRRVDNGGTACPCSSSRNCYGPRGGRYCITSGGNKRYR